jgi:2'-5' RNA ligase
VTRDVDGPGAAARWRLFIALPVPSASAAEIQHALAAQRRAHPDARWVDPERYHVTLRFLGAVAADLVDDLAASVEACARTSEPFPVTTGHGGGMGGRSDAAWLELLHGGTSVRALADRLDALLPAEVRATLRPSRPAPHLTSARRASAGLVDALRAHVPGPGGITWTADRLVLFRSHTGTPAGSSYEPLAVAVIGGRAAA